MELGFVLASVIGILVGSLVAWFWPNKYDGVFEINLNEAEEDFCRLVLETDFEDMAQKKSVRLKVLKL